MTVNTALVMIVLVDDHAILRDGLKSVIERETDLSVVGEASSRAEGCVEDIGNARMGKRHRMRWSPKGAHNVAVNRAAVLDGRLTVSHQPIAA